jgi:hypothetical protein
MLCTPIALLTQGGKKSSGRARKKIVANRKGDLGGAAAAKRRPAAEGTRQPKTRPQKERGARRPEPDRHCSGRIKGARRQLP